MTREAKLEKLLSMLFPEPGELRRWLSRHEATKAIVDELPGASESKAAVVHKAVELLEARGLVPSMLEELAEDELFLRRREEIQRLAGVWNEPRPAPDSESTDAEGTWPLGYRPEMPKWDDLPLVTRPGLVDIIAEALARQSTTPSQGPQMPQAEHLAERATIGILTALPKELAAVRIMLDNTKKWTAPSKRSRTRYFIGEVPSDEGGVHVVAVAMLPDMGNNSAALSAKALLDHFPNVRHLIMCGIAGGVPKPGDTEHDVRLGDIVVSNRHGVVQYDMQKLTAGRKPELRHPPRPPGRELLDAVRHLETEALLGDQPWEAFLERSSKIKKAVRPADNLNAKGEEENYPDDPEREAGLPRVFSGTIAASNTLLKRPALRDQLGRDYGVKAIEMEGSGVADASWYDGAGYLVVRGICDYCDENKGDLWQGYAAVAAAAYVRALLESMAAEEPSAGRSPGGSSGGGGGGAGPNISGTFTNSPVVIGSGNNVSVGGQHVHNQGSVGQQVNVSGDATFNLGDFLKK